LGGTTCQAVDREPVSRAVFGDYNLVNPLPCLLRVFIKSFGNEGIDEPSALAVTVQDAVAIWSGADLAQQRCAIFPCHHSPKVADYDQADSFGIGGHTARDASLPLDPCPRASSV
jgi:hypothetical protein